MISLNGGIKIGPFFSLDPTIKSDLAIVSHAHSDHLKAHNKIIATSPTLDLARLQYKRFIDHPLNYDTEMAIGPATVELKSAGHMLGSSQIIVEFYDEKIVYTGDFKFEKNLTCPRAEAHRCDTLLIDTTYGKPRYKFPPLEECRQRLLEFVDRQLRAGITPIILAYSFGKSQEVMKILSDNGIEFEAHSLAYQAALIYIKHGVEINGLYEFGERPSGDKTVIMPPNFLRYADTRGWNRFKTCFLSGWVIDKYQGRSGSNGYGIPFSDHASFEDIIKYVEIARPRKIYTLFGAPDIADYLNKMGFDATSAHFNSGHNLSRRNAINLELL